MRFISNSIRLLLLSTLLFSFNSFGQETDFIEYARYDNPPIQTDYIGQTDENETFYSRQVFTNNYSYKGNQVLKIETYTGQTSLDTLEYTILVSYDEHNFILNGLIYTDEDLGSLDLAFNPPILLPRTISPGEIASRSSQSLVQVGPVQAEATVDAKLEFIGFESVDVPIGRLENTMKIELSVSLFLASIELGSIKRTGWYHPLAGLVQEQNQLSNSIIQLNEINPSVELPTTILHWQIY